MPKANGYMNFVFAFQREAEKHDKIIFGTDLHKLADEVWSKLSLVEREPFKVNDRRLVVQSIRVFYDQLEADGRINQVGRSLKEELERKAAQKEFEKLRQETVEKFVAAGGQSLHLFKKKSFFVMASNVLLAESEGGILPAEIGIVHYSIGDGIRDAYHEFIDPGPIKCGFQSVAREHSKETHKIPVENFAIASNDYKKIVDDILQFIDVGASRFIDPMTGKQSKIILFTICDQINQNHGVINWLTEKYREKLTLSPEEKKSFTLPIEVVDLVELEFQIWQNIVKQTRPQPICVDDLNKSIFDYLPNIDCNYHEQFESRYCALGVAKRWCFMLSDVFCVPFGVQPTDNHKPKTNNVPIFEITLPWNPIPQSKVGKSDDGHHVGLATDHIVSRESKAWEFKESCGIRAPTLIRFGLHSSSSGRNNSVSAGKGRGRGRGLNSRLIYRCVD